MLTSPAFVLEIFARMDALLIASDHSDKKSVIYLKGIEAIKVHCMQAPHIFKQELLS